MMFTAKQYDEAIKSLTNGRRQMEADGRECSICGDGSHQAWECGHNPLLAMLLCEHVADDSEKLHETLHHLAGYDQAFGVQRGPRKVVLPEK